MDRITQLRKYFKLWSLNVKIECEKKEEFYENKRELENEREYAREHYDELHGCHYVQYYNEDCEYKNNTYKNDYEKLYGDYDD